MRRCAAVLVFLGCVLRRDGILRAAEPPSDCTTDRTLCLGEGRFQIEAAWRETNGTTGDGHAVAVTLDAGYFWFFDPGNVELVVKALDGCAVNGRFWFFSAGLTNLEVSIIVRDTVTGEVQTYDNPLGTAFAPILDTLAFSGCPDVSLVVMVSRYQFSPGGPEGPPIELQGGTTYHILFHSTDVEHGVSSIPLLGIPGGTIPAGGDFEVTLTPTAAQRGRYVFACTRTCGSGHGTMVGAIEVQ
jgi:heme/copper-type cytochrome/quinol oxidase subunit 2